MVGNLWDVTDKDIDKFLDSTLNMWLNNEITITEAVVESRNVTKLKYLNGAAPVIYGIPMKCTKLLYPNRNN